MIDSLEHLAVRTDLDLRGVCSTLRRVLGCSAFEFGAENETQWGEAMLGHVKLDVSRPYEAGTLRSWDATVPEGFEVGISVARCTAIGALAQRIADALGARVVHHRTWVELGSNIDRNEVYDPRA